jgi:hypothetical protein
MKRCSLRFQKSGRNPYHLGNKFTKADAEGPKNQKNKFSDETLKGTLYFRFGE